MKISNSNRRPGLSLTEVIVTLFVMALGILSLATLFPVGVIQMSQAFRDDRSGQTAHQADGMVRMWWQNEVVECQELRTGTLTTYTNADQATLTLNAGHLITPGEIVDVSWAGGARIGMTVNAVAGVNIAVSAAAGLDPLPPLNTPVSVRRYPDAFFFTMDNPNHPLAATAPQPQRALDNNPSYPVFLDPIGWQSRPIGTRNWMSGAANNIPRRSARPLGTSLTATVRACSMMDDLTFAENGQPDTASGSIAGSVVRDGAFNWCAVIQRPVNANRYVADLKILVFHTKGQYGGHVPGTNPGAAAEQIYTAPTLTSANGGATQVGLNVPIANLPFRTGGWIMDGTNTITANFYRVQSITEVGTGVILELDTPLKSTATSIYALRGLADVFDRPQLNSSGYQRQNP